MAAAVEQEARQQVAFREVNERIAELRGEWGEPAVALFICECSDAACTQSVEISPDEYEQVRRNGARFVVLAGHQLPEVERVVEGNDRFLVVEKFGAAAVVARSADPRQHE